MDNNDSHMHDIKIGSGVSYIGSDVRISSKRFIESSKLNSDATDSWHETMKNYLRDSVSKSFLENKYDGARLSKITDDEDLIYEAITNYTLENLNSYLFVCSGMVLNQINYDENGNNRKYDNNVMYGFRREPYMYLIDSFSAYQPMPKETKRFTEAMVQYNKQDFEYMMKVANIITSNSTDGLCYVRKPVKGEGE